MAPYVETPLIERIKWWRISFILLLIIVIYIFICLIIKVNYSGTYENEDGICVKIKHNTITGSLSIVGCDKKNNNIMAKGSDEILIDNNVYVYKHK